mmetsp:Transcript_37208/g.105017  ORF Transcript_37208/g.105017 Transcript_37208/m.105017 type:complete len:273 (-) Transcript_37208:15-833(-)
MSRHGHGRLSPAQQSVRPLAGLRDSLGSGGEGEDHQLHGERPLADCEGRCLRQDSGLPVHRPVQHVPHAEAGGPKLPVDVRGRGENVRSRRQGRVSQSGDAGSGKIPARPPGHHAQGVRGHGRGHVPSRVRGDARGAARLRRLPRGAHQPGDAPHLGEAGLDGVRDDGARGFRRPQRHQAVRKPRPGGEVRTLHEGHQQAIGHVALVGVPPLRTVRVPGEPRRPVRAALQRAPVRWPGDLCGKLTRLTPYRSSCVPARLFQPCTNSNNLQHS